MTKPVNPGYLTTKAEAAGMSCALPFVFSKKNMESHSFGTSDLLAEQAVHCLELVASLSKAGLSFQFKGGNSLLLILDSPQRFSIDVDIATDEPAEHIERILDAIISEYGVFLKWTKRQHKTKPWIPIASYHLFYNSHYAPIDQAFVMLDVQLGRSPYKTGMKPVICGDIYSSDIHAEVPLPASIIGDKLLAVGPYTLGIPVGKGKEAQRLKHVFDVSALCATGPDLSDIRESFNACLSHENRLQEKNITAADILSDTLSFCFSVMPFENKPVITDGMSPVLKENVLGLEPFSAHLFSKGYSWAGLQRDMTVAAAAIAAACTPEISGEQFRAALRGDIPEPGGAVDTKVKCDRAAMRQWGEILRWTDWNINGMQ